MDHLEASNLLTHYLAGDLQSGRLVDIEEHLARCPECAGWVTTYSLFTEALAPHLSSIEIVKSSLAPETLDPPSKELCAQHLERCRECRKEVELVREAAGRERQRIEPFRERNLGRPARSLAAPAALAATVLLALGAILVARAANRSPVEIVLADSILRGEETIVAGESIRVGTTELAPGAALTLKSGVVAFGDGFSVGAGAMLVVVTGESDDDDSPGF